jgi:cytochrome c553
VRNFGKADGTPLFDQKDLTKQALLANRPFATVAMVERGRMAATAANRIFFTVYEYTASNGDPASTKLALKAQLDNKGYNTSIPGNCLQCHGINSSTGHFTPTVEVKNAMFLPFDLNAFEYFSQVPTNALSRAKQEPAFRTLNRMIRFNSSFGSTLAGSELIGGWYDGDYHAGKFNGAFVPNGWKGNKQQEQLYKHVNAVGCRTCHISYNPTSSDNRPALNFRNYSDFEGFGFGTVKDYVCGKHQVPPANERRMPGAEQTLKYLWQSSGRAHLFAQAPVELSGDCRP